jgi:hypothetical protein
MFNAAAHVRFGSEVTCATHTPMSALGQERTLGADVTGLHWRTRHVAIRAEHATIACLWFEPYAAIGAVVEEPACVGRHRFGIDATAIRAGNGGLQRDHANVSARVSIPERQSG